MDFLKKKISIKNILSLARDGSKLEPYINNEWGIVDNVLNQTYNLPVSDVLNPLITNVVSDIEFNKKYVVYSTDNSYIVYDNKNYYNSDYFYGINGITSFSVVPTTSNAKIYKEGDDIGIKSQVFLSYQDCRKLVIELYTFQQYIEELCSICNLNLTNEILNLYINKHDDYILYGGDEMLIYLIELFNLNLNVTKSNNQKFLNHYQVIDENFLDYVINKENTYLGITFTLSDILEKVYGENVITTNQYYEMYLENFNKIGMIEDLFINYEIEPNTSLNPTNTTPTLELINRISGYSTQYFNDTIICKKIKSELNKTYSYINNASINFNILLTEEVGDLGVIFSPAEEWVKGREYKIGDIVLFEGESYILSKAATNITGSTTHDVGIINTTYGGCYVVNEKQVYFDDVIVDSSNGFSIGYEKQTNGVDFMHWIRSVRPDTTPKINIESRVRSQLETLKSYRIDNLIDNFFDTEKKYKVGKLLNEVYFDKIKYYSKIKSYEQISNYKGEIGHDVVIYVYVIDQGINNNVIIDEGLELTDIYHRYKTGSDPLTYIYEYDEVVINESLNDYIYRATMANVKYQISNINNINNYNISPFDQFHVFKKADEKSFNYDFQSRREYLLGTQLNPVVMEDIDIDRGINNNCFEKHLKLGEIRTLDDMISYNNGAEFRVKNNNG